MEVVKAQEGEVLLLSNRLAKSERTVKKNCENSSIDHFGKSLHRFQKIPVFNVYETDFSILLRF